jgi:DNA-binding winged helix-turn-helix (wHTH) protein
VPAENPVAIRPPGTDSCHLADSAVTTRPTPPAIGDPPLIWHFANAVLNERTLELRVGGALVQLERKPVELLRQLLRNANEVVTRDELLEAVWPGRIATEASLAKAVSRVRQELGDSEQTLIRTVHGYGYRLVAEVRVERPDGERDTPAVPRGFAFQPGMAVPERPQWQLKQHLASGGQGDVWLAEQPKSGERRVLKFVADAGGLLALKREITLYRLLREAIGPAARAVRLIDWNLETEPFFTESEYIPGGNFVHWAAARGGLAQIPIAIRLELLAQAADALAAAHGVGVLHRDLKPQNLLIDDRDPVAPEVRLADLGSGGLSEPTALDRYAITRMGLTERLAADSSGDSGTPIYRAPELLAGQMPTARADIYALGVMLYQCAVGDFSRQMAVGWEADIDDPVLRADIASAAAGNPLLRLADAAEFAHRLRELEARRAAWQAAEARNEADRQALAASERRRQENERLRARRFWLRATVAVLMVGLGVSLSLYRDAEQARRQAEAAATTAEAVTRYFTDDLIDIAATHDAKTLTVDQLFVKLAEAADERLGAEPAAEARVRTALAFTLVYLSNADGQSETQIRKAFARLLDIARHDLPLAWRTMADVVYSDFTRALSNEGVHQFVGLLDDIERQLGGRSGFNRDALADFRIKLAFELGAYRNDPQAGLALLERLRPTLDAASPRALDERVVRAKLLSLTGQPQAAVALYRAMLPAAGQEGEWPGWLSLAYVKAELGAQLIETGELKAAAEVLAAYAETTASLKLEDSLPAMKARLLIGQLRLAEGRATEALTLLGAAQAQSHRRVRDSWTVLAPKLAESGSLVVDAALLAGQPAAALAAARESADDVRLGSARNQDTGPTPAQFMVSLRLADALLADRQTAQAAELLAALDARAIAAFGPDNLYRAEQLRVAAMLARATGATAEAERQFDAADAMLLRIGGAGSWRLARLRAARAASAPAAG